MPFIKHYMATLFDVDINLIYFLYIFKLINNINFLPIRPGYRNLGCT